MKKWLRFAIELLQEEFAHRANFHRTHDIELGKRNPTVEIVEKLAKAIEVSPGTCSMEIQKMAVTGSSAFG